MDNKARSRSDTLEQTSRRTLILGIGGNWFAS